MRYALFILTLVLAATLVIAGHRNHPFGSALPPLGKLLDPFGGFWQNAEPARAPKSQVIDLPGIKEKVEVVFDERLVPHIFAANHYDACYAQGYITAKYRLWQMDFITRAAAGRLSEVVGEKTLERDRLQRRKGMTLAAERTLKAWSDNSEEMPFIEAYTAGRQRLYRFTQTGRLSARIQAARLRTRTLVALQNRAGSQKHGRNALFQE
ncbi:MAG: penicillin acylase family protein [Saprospiraceae bacterium]|nr:penicillin acylase family protein [Saprospiraceae bacterium]